MSGIGHSCKGGGAAINNSPVIINPVVLHIHIHSGASEAFISKIVRQIQDAVGHRNEIVELSASDIAVMLSGRNDGERKVR